MHRWFLSYNDQQMGPLDQAEASAQAAMPDACSVPRRSAAAVAMKARCSVVLAA